MLPTSRRRLSRAALAVIAVTGVTASTLVTGVTAIAADEPAGLTYLAPYYTQGDLTADRMIDESDIALLAAALGTGSADAGWTTVAPADYDANGVIELTDLAQLSQRMIYDDGPFELLEADTIDIQKAMAAGTVTAVELTQSYLDRIAAYDDATGLNSIITVNPKALEIAAALDAERAATGPRSLLHGIPVIAKDNYSTLDMPTTAGCTCLQANQTSVDAQMIEDLRAGGAVILAKANLYEFAVNTTTVSSLGGTTLNSYLPTATSGGSSGGTGASISANLGVIGLGTDTGGSIRIPSSWNSLVAVRPTLGLTSRDGIIPLALSQDTGGPMTRTVSDAAIALDAMAGSDPEDAATADSDAARPESYTSYLDDGALEGARIGFATNLTGSNASVLGLLAAARGVLQDQGATVVDVTYTIPSYSSGSTNEMRHDINEYLAKFANPSVPYSTFEEIANSTDNLATLRPTLVTRANVTQETYDAWIVSHNAEIATARAALLQFLADNDLDALMFPSTTGTAASVAGNNNRLSPFTGLPAIGMPMGYAADGGSVNFELIGPAYSEGTLLGFAYDYEQAADPRVAPSRFPELAR